MVGGAYWWIRLEYVVVWLNQALNRTILNVDEMRPYAPDLFIEAVRFNAATDLSAVIRRNGSSPCLTQREFHYIKTLYMEIYMRFPYIIYNLTYKYNF